MGSAKSERLIGIDCLRAIAVCWVMLYHYGPVPLITKGTYGVLLFFIISGFCIAFSAETSQSAWHFYAKRFGRLFPALVVCGLLTTVVKQLFLPTGAPLPTETWRNYLLTLYAVPTLNLFRVDYVPPDGAYWSLGVEFQFYFLCCFVIAAGLKPHLLKITGVVLIFWTMITPLDQANSATFFQFFLAGLSVAAIVRGKLYEGICGLVVAIGVDLYQTKLHFNQPEVPIEFTRSVTLWIGTGMVYLAARYEPKSVAVRRLLLPAAFIGLVSYPVYLFHQDIGRIALMEIHIRSGIGSDIFRILVLPGFVVFVAWLIYIWVERPLIRPLTALLASPRHLQKSLPHVAPATLKDEFVDRDGKAKASTSSIVVPLSP